MSLTITEFFDKQPIFRIGEAQQLYPKYVDNPAALSNLLNTYKRRHKLGRITSGLYFSLDYWKDYERIDPYVVAAKLAHDAVIGYHTALGFCLKGAINREEYVFLTTGNKIRSGFKYQKITYRAVSFPQKLVEANKAYYAVNQVEHHSVLLRLTQLERSWVDMLDRPYLLNHNWEEIMRYTEAISAINAEVVIEYLKLLGQSFIAAKIGFFMELMRKRWRIQVEHLKEIHALVTHTGSLQLRDLKTVTYVISPRWKILVPEFIMQKKGNYA